MVFESRAKLSRLLEEPSFTTKAKKVVARDGSSNNLDVIRATGCRTPK
jgi:hypothetical protein